MQPLERLLNLLTLLLEAERPIPFERIRELIPAYQHDDIASAKRMFERDKDDLRDAGVPLELTFTDVWEVEQGYAIAKDRYYLPELTFTAEELAALFVAASSSPEAERSAVQKLLVGSGAESFGRLSAPSLPAIDPGGAEHLQAFADALAERKALTFGYRRADGQEETRTVDPHGLVFRAGNWYAVGMDRGRDAVRAFRISRVTSRPRTAGDATEPPDGFRAAEHVQTPGEDAEGTARVAFSEKVAWMALSSVPGARQTDSAKGWIEAEVPVAGRDLFISWLAGFGPDARLLDEGPLRDALIAHLESAREAV